jgi:hypothetical protein
MDLDFMVDSVQGDVRRSQAMLRERVARLNKTLLLLSSGSSLVNDYLMRG